MIIQEIVLKKGEADWVYLAEVASLVQRDRSEGDERTVMERTLHLVRELAEAWLVVIGDLSGPDGKFSPWQLSVTDTVERIRREWMALGRPINVGDVCWLSNTLDGDKRAVSLPDISLD